MATRKSRRASTKLHTCPSCGVGPQGQSVWSYHGKGSGLRQLVQHRMRAHSYEPRTQHERDAVRRFV